MRMYGYKKFNEEHYFPIQTDPDSKKADDKSGKDGGAQSGFYDVVNLGMTKNLKDKPKSPFMISDIVQVFTAHARDMANYHGMAMPIVDAVKWYNWKSGEWGVQRQINRVFGPGNTRVILITL